jgi:CheY-like chemotaxis protein
VKSVLIVDAMPQTLTLLCRLLQSQGHPVYAAQDAATAYSIVRSHGEDIGLVLLDTMIGRTRGDQLVGVLRERLPNSRYIFMTGPDAFGEFEAGRLTRRGETVLRKPFQLSQVAEAIRTALADHLPAEPGRLDVRRPHKNS